MKYKAVVIGASAGGMETIGVILTKLPLKLSVPIVNTMPKAAIGATDVDYILGADEIAEKIIELVGYENERQ